MVGKYSYTGPHRLDTDHHLPSPSQTFRRDRCGPCRGKVFGSHSASRHSLPRLPAGMMPGMKMRRGPLLWLADRSRRFWVIVIALNLPVFYMLSWFPLGVLHRRGFFPNSPVVSAYAWPIRFANRHGPEFVQNMLGWHWETAWGRGGETVEPRASDPHWP